ANERDRAFPDGRAIDGGAEAAPDQALDFHGAPALAAACGCALHAIVGRARPHPGFGGAPAFALAAQEAGNLLLAAGRTRPARTAEGNQHRTFGMPGETALNRNRAQLIGRAAAGALQGHGKPLWQSGRAVYHCRPCHRWTDRMIRSMTAFA